MDKYLYFFIYYPRIQKEISSEIEFVVPDKKSECPECIYYKETYDDDNKEKIKYYNYKKVYKVPKSEKKGKDSNKYYFEFEIDDDKYIITFDSGGRNFIYDVNLQVGRRIIHITHDIDQSIIEYYEKIEDFIGALEENGENDKIDLLYKDTIDLYSKQQGFGFLISLFLKLYQKKGLCSTLMNEFNQKNKNSKDIDKNMDRKAYLKNFSAKMEEISLNSEQIIKDNKYNIIDFYGIILCYLNYYDIKNFSIVIDKLSSTNPEDTYEILIVYNAHFANSINKSFDFFNNFINYIIKNYDFHTFKIGLKYIKQIEIFLNVLDKNKEEIYQKYFQPEKDPKTKEKLIIKLDRELEFKKEEKKVGSDKYPIIIDYIKSILKYSKENEIILIQLTSDFWNHILNYYQEPIMDNIYICSKLRQEFIKYKELLEKIITNKKSKIYTDAKIYDEIDEFSCLLDKIIKGYIRKDKELSDIDKLYFITQYNPYYDYHETKYSSKVETDIFDSFNLNKINNKFINDFLALKFELVFKENIHKYIDKIVSKIKRISDFENIIKLFNFKLFKNKNIILDALVKRYDSIIGKDIEKLCGRSLDEALKIIAYLAFINFIYKSKEKQFDFIIDKIYELSEKIQPLIFIELIELCISSENRKDKLIDDENKKTNEMKDFIFAQFSKKVTKEEDIKNIIRLIDCLNGNLKNKKKENDEKDNITDSDKLKKEREKNIYEFLEKLIENNLFTKEEFFSNTKNLKIELMYELYNKGIIDKTKQNNQNFFTKIEKVLTIILNDLDGNIKKKKLEEFLKMDDIIIRQRLSLINIILKLGYDPNEKFKTLKNDYKEMSKDIDDLIFIRDNIIKYFKDTYKDIIKNLIDYTKAQEKININQYKKGEVGDLIKLCSDNDLKNKADNVNEVKNFLLFKVIYEINPKKDDISDFNEAYKKYKSIGKFLNEKSDVNKLYEENKIVVNKIRDMLCNNEDDATIFIEDLKRLYKITNDTLIDELMILFNTKKYDLEINSIISFFKYFPKDKDNEWNKKLSKEYLNLPQKSPQEIKNRLKELKDNNIYNYRGKNNYYTKLFKCLYNKQEAIEFIFEKINQNINVDYLEEKIQPTNRAINIEDVIATEKCIFHMNKMKDQENNFKRLDYVKGLDPKEIDNFDKYSKIYSYIIELDRVDDSSDNIYEQVIKIIKIDLNLKIDQDTEEFFYYIKDQSEPEKITIEELIHLKNKIHIQGDKDENKKDDEKDDKKDNKKVINDNESDIIKNKCQTLIFFKNLIINLEKINKLMKILRIKGSTLPIKINIKVKMHDVKYFLEGEETDYFKIQEFLLNVKNKHISLLNKVYKQEMNIRFLYGKQFRSFMKHLDKTFHIDSFLRYILNITDNNKSIKEGKQNTIKNVTDFLTEYELYDQNSFQSISMYIRSLFKVNNISTIAEHYGNMIITPKDTYKGIYSYECQKNTMEKHIIDLFWDKLTELPIAQNLLIINKETSSEEIQSFLHRAILCNYNTLFVIELNDSFSEYQQSVMASYLDQLLAYKNEKYSEEKKQIIGKKLTQKYLYPCIVFVYEKENKNKINTFLKELNKVDEQKIKDIRIDSETYTNKILKKLGDINVVTSEICGLGKSEKIKKLIGTKKYFHFPLGGTLTKNDIYDKLEILLEKIQNYNCKNVAIHLDLTETKVISIMNEFFFSLLITKFYSNNENILFIPKDISIYIEIPNCFDDYLSKFCVLNIFNKIYITLDKMPDFSYSNEIIKIFQKYLEEINSNEKIKEFVKEHIGIPRYSFHQINIFIKLFISQFSKFKGTLKLTTVDKSGNTEDITKKSLIDFAKCTRYFTNGGFAELLTNKEDNNNNRSNDHIDKLSRAYKDDLGHVKFDSPLIFLNHETMTVHQFYIPARDSKNYENSKDYLKELKKILDIPNEIEIDKETDNGQLKSLISILEEKDKNYVITNDNFRKMILLVYRIKSNVPVIIMGDTGCGKTMLITKLNQLLNNGVKTVEIINIHPGINDELLCKLMDEKDEIARKNKGKELWLFFDEINTCLSLSLITEIFINRTYEGKKISDNIRLIGACNPYKRRKVNKEKCGLSLSDDNDDELVYLVQPLPQSLLFYVFSFGSIDDKDEKSYIKSIIEKLFTKDEKDLHEYTTEIISLCHKYLRREFDDSVVSLREIARFTKCVEFFKDYFKKKNKFLNRQDNEKNNKIRSIICSIYLCYYIRLVDDSKTNRRNMFEREIRASLLKLVNSKDESSKLKELNEIIRKDEGDNEDNTKINIYKKKVIEEILSTNLTEEEKKMIIQIQLNKEEEKIATQILKNDNSLNSNEIEKLKKQKIQYFKEIKLKYKKYYENTEEKEGDLVKNFKNKELKNEISLRPETINYFSDFIKIEQDFLIDKIELDDGIGKNTLLKENVFLLFISLLTNIPLIIIGKPGTGKSLSAQLMNKSMKGKYSNNEFFKLFPKIIQTYFQGSESTQPEDVESLFEKAGKKLEYYKKKKESQKDYELPISMVLFDELGLAEKSESNPLKVLHSRLDYAGKEDGISFVGISNYTLDAAKINRALVLSVPDLDQIRDEITKTARCIVESICPSIKNDKIFDILSKTYYDYKNNLQIIKELIVFKQYVKKYIPKKNLSQINKDNNTEIKIDQNNLNNIQQLNQNNIQNPTQNEARMTETSESNHQRNDNDIHEEKKKEIWEEIKKKPFGDIKQEDLFRDLIKKEKKIRKDFHGNRDFYHLIKGIANELRRSTESIDEEKVKIIVKYIERNFGGIDYEIDIDFSLTLEDIDTNVKRIQKILQDYILYNENGVTKLKSVYLFKAIYNLQFEEKDPNISLKIDPNKINDYNLNNCINNNIWDINSRYLLLEIKQSLTTLIYQNIKLQNIIKESIVLYDGSPFIDDNNNVYRFMKLNQIQGDASQDKLIIIENLNQIHPFLFDLYNRNFQIVNGKKFARISLDNFDEQLTEVNDGFRIIILVEKRFVKDCNLAFLNRLEKIILSFDELLDAELKAISKQLINDLNLKNKIKNYDNTNYSLNNLLINCGDEEIQGLIYHYSIDASKDGNESDNEDTQEQKVDEKQLREIVINKIYKILPQDIIVILDKKNILRKTYIEKKTINNFNDYMNEEYKLYKISIIYTYTNRVDGLNSGMSFWISEIRSEIGLKSLIEEIKNRYNKEEKKYICIHFEQSNSKHIKFICNFLLNNFENDDFNYLILIHINRDFNKTKEKIYSLPDINSKINQIFIDNLNSNNTIKLADILSNDIQKFFNDNKDKLKLNDEFNKTLKIFLKKELNENNIDFDKITEYNIEAENYINEEKSIKKKIMEITFKIIDNDNDNENSDIIEKIFNEKLINNFTVDIISCILEYIIEKIFNKKLKSIFKVLEDNNILTTLIDIKKSNYEFIDKSRIEEIIIAYLDELTIDKVEKCKCKFLYNYNIPGLYNFYVNISNYIYKNIISNYSNNEDELRKSLTNDSKLKTTFHKTEDNLLGKVYKEMEENYKLECRLMDIIKDDKEDLIFKDYITFYLQKYRKIPDIYHRDDIYHKIIILILKLRFNFDNKIKESIDNKNDLLKRMIWLESNVNYILNILNIIDNAKAIFNNDVILYKNIEEEIYQEDKIKIKYITNDKRNPEITREVNQCYYILLAGICYCITSDEIKLIDYNDDNYSSEIQIDINHYCDKLKEINKTMKVLSDDLLIFLNEMYIIDELIKVIEIFTIKMNIDKIQSIKKELRENANIIQDNFEKKDKFKFSTELINNFEIIYDLISKNGEIYKTHRNYYTNLRYILLSEIKKISDTDYRSKIIEKLLEENEMIKKSIDIFQIVLKPYLKKNDKFKDNKDSILNGEDNIIKLIEDKLDNKIVLEETLLYLFEKNTLNYFSYIKKSQINLDEKPLNIFKDSINYLNEYISNSEKYEAKMKETCKLFCLGYIKSYCFAFINMFKDSKKIIKVINDENPLCKMIRLYIYKIFYNKYTINFFYKEENIKKYELKKYKDFNEFIKNKELNNIYKLEFEVKTLKNDLKEESSQLLEKFKKDNFKNKIEKRKFDIDQYGIDNFYIASYNPFLSYLYIENGDINENFYPNICISLFQEKKIILKALELFYQPNKYKKIVGEYNINSNNIQPILLGYRYCLNELSIAKTNGIYYSIYDINKTNYLKEKLYPGNDTKFNEVFSMIINHFKYKPKEGCYVCLCPNMYYHSIPSGFPGVKDLGICPKCNMVIGSCKDEKGIKMVNRKNYIRILKDDDEIKELKKDQKTASLLREINIMTLKDFIDKHITKTYENEKGILITNENNFRNPNKIIRNLSQVSYRTLNYILYVHLFFARVITDNKIFDQYLPNKMAWVDTIYECWNLLTIELLELKIDSIVEFMYYIFPELFPMLNEQKYIDKYSDLINFENKIDSKISELINSFKANRKNIIKIKNENEEDKVSTFNLLTEKFEYQNYNRNDYPFYRYLYYTDYLNEDYLKDNFIHKDVSQFPILKMYLDSKNKSKSDKNKNLLDKLYLFNNTLNLISQKYFNNISREKKIKLKDDEIYKSNKELFDNFIDFYNNLNIKEIKNKSKLSKDNDINDFFVDSNNKFGKTYIDIYKMFIKQQNDKLEELLNIKIEKGIFDVNCKNRINIQQVNEKEIFTLILPKKVTFVDILFNASYRKILDNFPISYRAYKEYKINYYMIEDILTDLLLKNKKLLNDNIAEFIYNNEVFINQVTDLLTTFKTNYNCVELILDDKIPIYKFYDNNDDNIDLYQKIINDFIELIKYLNNSKKENNSIKEDTKLYEVIGKLNDLNSKNFINIFEKNDNLTVNKTVAIFEYFLKIIFGNVSSELSDYQKDLEESSKEVIDKYFEGKHLIERKEFAYAIRLFATLVLFLEEDKENKIKSNQNNIINYMKASDLWKTDINEDNFNNELNKLKSMKVSINQIIELYNYLGKDIQDNYLDDVKQRIKNENAMNGDVEIEEEENKKKIRSGDSDDDENRKVDSSEDEDDEPKKHINGGDEDDDDRT